MSPTNNKAIRSNRVVMPDGVRPAVVLIRDGMIVDVIEDVPENIVETTDLGNYVLMPGVIDPHVHINEPGRTEWEGFDTGTKAAIAGGVTMLVDMPLNADPVTTTKRSFELKLESTKGKLHTNCGFWGGVVPGNEKDIEPLIKSGVLGFKAFLTHSGIDEFPNVGERELEKVMPIIAHHGLPLLVHCELSDEIDRTGKDPRSYRNYLASRPKQWENSAVNMMISLCKKFNCRTHIVHLSSVGALPMIVKAKNEGLPLTVETCQHYLYFNAEDIPDGNTAYKCAPPIREKANNDLLWEALKNGIIDYVATDHSPAPPAMKETESGNFMKAWGGIASIQFALPVLWSAAKKRGHTLSDIAKWLCENPARLPGQEKIRGKIAKGYAADLVAWKPEEIFIVTKELIEHKHKITPYIDKELYGVVQQTWLDGEKVFDRGKFLHLNKGKTILRTS
ncbi:MAG TPA: allantoinase AllB [Chitinophagaceae bacterium]|nr:allantoinase AllB [Chitinophagaceae bacterium]